MVEHLEFLVEELSMEALLHGLLPNLLAVQTYDIRVFQGKPDLLRKLPQRLKGYTSAFHALTKIIVLVDRDTDDCIDLKHQLEQIATRAGVRTRSKPDWEGRFTIINRIVIEELEAWYFGDWQAVRAAYPKAPRRLPPKYRYPDAIRGGTWEAFERVLKMRSGLNKVEAARRIGPHFDPQRNTSPSFRCFCEALTGLINE